MQGNVVVEKKGIFEPPAKPRITKEMKQAVAQVAQKEALKMQLIELKRRYKREIEAQKELLKNTAQKEQAQKRLIELKQEYRQVVAKKKQEIKSVGGTRAEQKKILKEQLAQMKKQYEKDMEAWNKVPEVSAEQLAEYKAKYAALEKDVEKRRAQAKSDYKQAIERAKKAIRFV